MKKRSPDTILNESIALMEIKRDLELDVLKENAHEIRENLRPLNLAKNTFSTLTGAPDIKSAIGRTVIGLISGFLFRKILIGSSHNPIKRAVGSVLQTAVVGIVANNSGKIASKGRRVLINILTKIAR